MRAHQLSSKLIDLTHDTVPEKKWRPIAKTYDRVPPELILNDKILLREWQGNQEEDYEHYVHSRKKIDNDLFRKLQEQGEIIKQMPNYRELNAERSFWKTEEYLSTVARKYLGEL